MLLFEFLQMLYYVFYKVEFVNEFKPAYAVIHNSTHTASGDNSTNAAANFTLTSKEDQDESAKM
jgi:hypothetical protein